MATLPELDLPPIHMFHRPAWAYPHLAGVNWQEHLRDLLFPETQILLDRLDYDGGMRVAVERLEELAHFYKIPCNIYLILAQQNAEGKTREDFIKAYREIEMEIVKRYYNEQRRKESPHTQLLRKNKK
ncbi:MAG: hypothetical protein ACLFTK_06650 [Anaerolineales bacterium]